MVKYKCLRIDENEGEAYLLGYPMGLTPTELRVLCALATDREIATDVLSERCGLAELSSGNLSVHICAINRKAETIGKRKLILHKGSNYYINEFM